MGEWAVLTQPDCGGRSNRASAVLAREQPGLLAGRSRWSRAVSRFSLEVFTGPAE